MAKFYPEVLSDEDKELFDSLWGDLRSMYQRDVAMADNGIPFRMRIEEFITDYLPHTKEAKLKSDNPSSPKFPPWLKEDALGFFVDSDGDPGDGYDQAEKMYDYIVENFGR